MSQKHFLEKAHEGMRRDNLHEINVPHIPGKKCSVRRV